MGTSKWKSHQIGWDSEGWTPTKCFGLLSQLRCNQLKGNGPCTMAESREQGQQEREQAKRSAVEQARCDMSFEAFFTDTFLPDAETRWTTETTRKAREHVAN